LNFNSNGFMFLGKLRNRCFFTGFVISASYGYVKTALLEQRHKSG